MQKDQVILMLQFCKLAGIETKGMTSQFGKEDNQLILTREDKNGMNNAIQKITITLHTDTDSIDIKKQTRVEYDFQPIKDEAYSYQVVDNQAFYLFEVKDELLSLHTSVVSQNITEDTLGNQSGIIVDFNSYIDTLNEDKRRIVQFSQNIISTDSSNYSIPDGYRILDGIDYISDVEGKSK